MTWQRYRLCDTGQGLNRVQCGACECDRMVWDRLVPCKCSPDYSLTTKKLEELVQIRNVTPSTELAALDFSFDRDVS